MWRTGLTTFEDMLGRPWVPWHRYFAESGDGGAGGGSSGDGGTAGSGGAGGGSGAGEGAGASAAGVGDAGGKGSTEGPGGKVDTHTITVDGAERTVTTAELLKMAEKSGGADKRFEEASRIRVEAQDAVRTADLLKRAATDDDAFRELGRVQGRTEEEIDSLLAYMKGEAAPEGDDEAAKKAAAAAAARAAAEGPGGKLTAEQQEQLDAGMQARLQQEKQRVLGEMKNLLDTDDVIGVEKVKDGKVRASLFEMFEADVVGRLARQEKYGPELLASSLQKVRRWAQGAGTVTSEVDPNSPEEVLKAAHKVGLGPDSKDATDAIQAGKIPPRLPMTDPGYADRLALRAMLDPNRSSEES